MLYFKRNIQEALLWWICVNSDYHQHQEPKKAVDELLRKSSVFTQSSSWRKVKARDSWPTWHTRKIFPPFCKVLTPETVTARWMSGTTRAMMGSTLLGVLCLFREALWCVWSRFGFRVRFRSGSERTNKCRPGAAMRTELEWYLPQCVNLLTPGNTHKRLGLWLSKVCLVTETTLKKNCSQCAGDMQEPRVPEARKRLSRLWEDLLVMQTRFALYGLRYESQPVSRHDHGLLDVFTPENKEGRSLGSAHHKSS